MVAEGVTLGIGVPATGVRRSEGMINVCPGWSELGSVIPLAAVSDSTVVLNRSARPVSVSPTCTV